jgi:hypothetical protein
MMRVFTYLLFLLPTVLSAQKWVGSDTHAEIDSRTATKLEINAQLPNDTTVIKSFLFQKLTNLQGTDLVVEHVKRGPKTIHYQFTQTINNRKVFRGTVKVNLTHSGRILSVFDNTFPLERPVDAIFPDHTAYHSGLMVHYNTPSNGKLDHYNLQEIYFPANGKLIPAIRLEVVEASDRYYELVLNKDVRVIYQNDLLSYAALAPEDTTVTVWVFNPDPLTSASQTYSAPYVDNGDNDVVELNAERIPVQITATYDAGTFSLANQYVIIQELSNPVIQPVSSNIPEFNYTRSESGFEDVNAFYHITNFQEHIRSLGFTDIVDYQIAVDPHALNGADNSNFNAGFSPPRLQFGEGGVDDAEDADVIIHEFGHAIMHSAAPGTNNGTERRALDEAVGDYFASSYSRHISDYRWEDVFTWDGHNQYWNGRSSVSSDHYPEDLNNNLYTDADIWAATLMQIWGDIGREATDAIMIQAAYGFANNMTMRQAAELFVQADTILYDGIHGTPILDRMCARGLLECEVGIGERSQSHAFEVYNSAGFSSGTGELRIVAKDAITVNLYNAVGQLLHSKSSGSGTLQLSSRNLHTGMYLLEVTTKDSRSTVKLLKH